MSPAPRGRRWRGLLRREEATAFTGAMVRSGREQPNPRRRRSRVYGGRNGAGELSVDPSPQRAGGRAPQTSRFVIGFLARDLESEDRSFRS